MYSSKKRMKVASGNTQTGTQISEPSRAMKESPNWLEMPRDLMANILQRLNYVEILNNACKVCTTWEKICKDPAMWKVIHVLPPNYCCDIEILTMKAVDLSCGELIDLSIDSYEIIDVLDYIVRRSSKIKHLCVKNCSAFTGRGFGWAIKQLPQLEKLHFSHVYPAAKDIEVIGQNCPQLKSFTMNQVCQRPRNDDNALAIAKNMPGLSHLQLIGNNMTKIGLQAILDGCTHLESLDLRRSYYLKLGGKFGKLCMKRIKDFKRTYDSLKNCEFDHEYDECDIYDHMYSSGYSDVDDSSEDDFYESNEVSAPNNTSNERDFRYEYDYEYYD